jgi:hypothetical protein
MMQPMSDYFYGDAETKDQEHLNLHSIALDDAEASFPAPEEVRSTTTSRNRFPVSYKPKAKTRYFWIASIVALLMVVIMVPAIVVRGGKKDSAIVPAKVADPPPRPRPSLESVVDYFEKEGISEASLLKDVNSPQFKAAQWLANEDTANIVVPPHETKVRIGPCRM